MKAALMADPLGLGSDECGCSQTETRQSYHRRSWNNGAQGERRELTLRVLTPDQVLSSFNPENTFMGKVSLFLFHM